MKEDVSSDPVDADSANSSITDPAQDLATGAAAFSPASSKNPRSSALTGSYFSMYLSWLSWLLFTTSLFSYIY